MESIIKWQTGMPEQSGLYLVTLSTGEVTVMEWYNPYTSSPYWLEEEREVVAWCDFKDMEPYKMTMATETKHTLSELGREHRIHVSPAPRYFCGMLIGWEVDIISFTPCVESKTNACGRLKTEEEAIQAGIEYVEELLCRMTENTALNALYRQYEDEKRRLELYGHVSSLTYEEWLEIKKLNKDK